MYADILLTSLIISLFCAGLSLISREGYVLYFFRKPFEEIDRKLTEIESHLDTNGDFHTRDLWEYEQRKLKRLKLLSKPLITCCTCMASIWGVVIYVVLHGITLYYTPQLILCCIISAFLNTLFINLIEKLDT